ncbi:hypothetical protein BO78DRAFT_309331, partial [Aspergillus sclerotiicarbonarius CBS 121057]
LINKILIEYLDKFITIYINNILIYNNNIIEFYITKTKFLGFIIIINNIYINLIKITVITKWEILITI